MRLRLKREQGKDEVAGSQNRRHEHGSSADEPGKASAGPVAQRLGRPPLSLSPLATAAVRIFDALNLQT
jgi:hypothetical protein